jgi:adenine-specific DNA-methyltransferase
MGDYLKDQIITYMGNKRKLLHKIKEIIVNLEEVEGKKLDIGDGFSGSGIVSRLFKQHSNKLYSNDIADYSETLNKCYLSNINHEEYKTLNKYIETANKHADKKTKKYNKPYVSGNWSPKDKITPNCRVYFTKENGERIDILRNYIATIPEYYQPFLLAPLLVECSIHNNTNGQFSAFYKNGDKGQYGGKHNIDVKRITSPITLKMPVHDNNKCKVTINKMDTNKWVKQIPKLDLVYYDPPYNKHPYIIFYFLLNIINNWDLKLAIPDTNRGQPLNWEKSEYNSTCKAESALENLIENTNSSYILLSYNNGGIIKLDKLQQILSKYGKVTKIPVEHKTYNKLKGLSEYKRKKEKEEIKEYFWLLMKDH